MKALLALCRVSNLPTVWMNALTAMVLSTGVVAFGPLVIGLLSFSAFYSGGMAFNDWCDRDFDAKEQPFRPIPSGRLSVGEATACWAGLFIAGLLAALMLPHATSAIAGAVALLAVIVLYDIFHKAHPGSVLLMAGARTMVFVVMSLGLTGGVSAPVWVAGGLQFGYTLLVTVVARGEGARQTPRGYPLIPRMIAGMSVLDGLVLAVWHSPAWLFVGIGAAALTHFGQRYVRGD
jgi:4-hydroxybenzoate polyprenyltransferase